MISNTITSAKKRMPATTGGVSAETETCSNYSAFSSNNLNEPHVQQRESPSNSSFGSLTPTSFRATRQSPFFGLRTGNYLSSLAHIPQHAELVECPQQRPILRVPSYVNSTRRPYGRSNSCHKRSSRDINDTKLNHCAESDNSVTTSAPEHSNVNQHQNNSSIDNKTDENRGNFQMTIPQRTRISAEDVISKAFGRACGVRRKTNRVDNRVPLSCDSKLSLEKLKLCTVTWNLKRKMPFGKGHLHELSDLIPAPSSYDIIVIGAQECNYSVPKMSRGNFKAESYWHQHLSQDDLEIIIWMQRSFRAKLTRRNSKCIIFLESIDHREKVVIRKFIKRWRACRVKKVAYLERLARCQQNEIHKTILVAKMQNLPKDVYLTLSPMNDLCNFYSKFYVFGYSFVSPSGRILWFIFNPTDSQNSRYILNDREFGAIFATSSAVDLTASEKSALLNLNPNFKENDIVRIMKFRANHRATAIVVNKTLKSAILAGLLKAEGLNDDSKIVSKVSIGDYLVLLKAINGKRMYIHHCKRDFERLFFKETSEGKKEFFRGHRRCSLHDFDTALNAYLDNAAFQPILSENKSYSKNLRTLVYVSKRIASKVSNVKLCSSSVSSISGDAAHAIYFKLESASFCFVNANITGRNNPQKTLGKFMVDLKFDFSVPDVTTVAHHCFWMGSMELDQSMYSVRSSKHVLNIEEARDADPLSTLMKNKKVFFGFSESLPKHPSSPYKIGRTSPDTLDTTLSPQFSMRILWKSLGHFSRKVKHLKTKVLHKVSTSCKKPVLSLFEISDLKSYEVLIPEVKHFDVAMSVQKFFLKWPATQEPLDMLPQISFNSFPDDLLSSNAGTIQATTFKSSTSVYSWDFSESDDMHICIKNIEQLPRCFILISFRKSNGTLIGTCNVPLDALRSGVDNQLRLQFQDLSFEREGSLIPFTYCNGIIDFSGSVLNPESLKIGLVTWNVGNKMPFQKPFELESLIPRKENYDIIVVGTQECAYKDEKDELFDLEVANENDDEDDDKEYRVALSIKRNLSKEPSPTKAQELSAIFLSVLAENARPYSKFVKIYARSDINEENGEICMFIVDKLGTKGYKFLAGLQAFRKKYIFQKKINDSDDEFFEKTPAYAGEEGWALYKARGIVRAMSVHEACAAHKGIKSWKDIFPKGKALTPWPPYDPYEFPIIESTIMLASVKDSKQNLDDEVRLMVKEEFYEIYKPESNFKVTGPGHFQNSLLDHLGQNYLQIKEKRSAVFLNRLEMNLFVFVHKRHRRALTQSPMNQISCSAAVATGIAGIAFNKGGLGIKLSIYGMELCFISAHLAAHLHHLENRLSDVSKIFEKLTFGEGLEAHFQCHHVFFMGDLNFRVDLDNNKLNYKSHTPKVEKKTKKDAKHQKNFNIISSEIKKNNWEYLFEYDQLSNTMAHKRIFSKYKEGRMNFHPTFKVQRSRYISLKHEDPEKLKILLKKKGEFSDEEIIGLMNLAEAIQNIKDQLTSSLPMNVLIENFISIDVGDFLEKLKRNNITLSRNIPEYTNQRMPSWCDRILWRSMPTHAHLLKQVDLRPVYDMSSSDHKPVRAQFQIANPAGHSPYGFKFTGHNNSLSFCGVELRVSVEDRGSKKSKSMKRFLSIKKWKSLQTFGGGEAILKAQSYPLNVLKGEKSSLKLSCNNNKTNLPYLIFSQEKNNDVGISFRVHVEERSDLVKSYIVLSVEAQNKVSGSCIIPLSKLYLNNSLAFKSQIENCGRTFQSEILGTIMFNRSPSWTLKANIDAVEKYIYFVNKWKSQFVFVKLYSNENEIVSSGFLSPNGGSVILELNSQSKYANIEITRATINEDSIAEDSGVPLYAEAPKIMFKVHLNIWSRSLSNSSSYSLDRNEDIKEQHKITLSEKIVLYSPSNGRSPRDEVLYETPISIPHRKQNLLISTRKRRSTSMKSSNSCRMHKCCLLS
eukprot:UC4_evm5s670